MKNRPYKKTKIDFELTYHSDVEIVEEFGEVEIEGYGIIRVNNLGTKVYTKTGKFPTLFTDDWGYVLFNIGSSHRRNFYKTMRLHRLVALAFIPNPDPENLTQVNHKDGNKLNNCVTNLEWISGKGNVQHAWKTGLIKPRIGSKSPRAILTEEQVLEIREKYSIYKYKISELAKEYGVSRNVIGNIIARRTWTHI